MSTPSRLERSMRAIVVDARGTRACVEVVLGARSDDPLAVYLRLNTGRAAVTWVFARGLLVTGMTAVAGGGTVRVWPAAGDLGEPRVTVLLTAHGERAEVSVPAAGVEAFLGATAALCDAGALTALIDVELAALLS